LGKITRFYVENKKEDTDNNKGFMQLNVMLNECNSY
jgi:hypothetical protein